jgi:hypothetical protein
MRLHLGDVITRAMQNHLDDVHTCLPGQIVSYDYKTQSAQVKPLIKKTFYNGKTISLPVIVNVPVAMPAGGGATINLPMTAGDKVILVFSERSLERWLATGEDSEQGAPRRFDLSDAFAIPGINALNFSSKGNGKDFVIEFKNSTITIKENGQIELKTNSGVFSITSDGKFDLSNSSDSLFSILNDTLNACKAITVQGHGIDNVASFNSLISRLNSLV